MMSNRARHTASMHIPAHTPPGPCFTHSTCSAPDSWRQPCTSTSFLSASRLQKKKNIHRGTQLDSPLYFQDHCLPNRSRHCSRTLHPMRQNVPREAEKTRLRTDCTLCRRQSGRRRHYLSPLILFECLFFFRRHA